MKKYVLILIVFALMLTGCSSKNDINIEQLATELNEQAKFEDTLTKLDDKMISKVYNIESAKKSIAYVGSGATAEEIALFEFESNNEAKEAYKILSDRIARLKKDYTSYMPKEVARLDKAVIECYQNYLILVVSSDDNVRNIINNYK